MSIAGDSAKIRAEILRTPGAMRCTMCTVITQGGGKGLARHLEVCHR